MMTFGLCDGFHIFSFIFGQIYTSKGGEDLNRINQNEAQFLKTIYSSFRMN
jgi:hypothetical protein